MKIGLIKCSTLPDSFRSVYGDVSDRFMNLFSRHESTIDFEPYDAVKGNLPDVRANLNGFLITGSASSAFDDTGWISDTKQFLRNLYREQKKMVGICFGHQVIAEALGGKVVRSSRGWGLGVQTAFIEKPGNWMKPFVKACNIIVSHQDQVETLPPHATLLGSTAHCRNFLYTIDKSVLGIQGHPEIDKTFAAALYASRIESLGQKAIDDAINSLQEPVDQTLWAKWIVNFLNQP